MSVASTTRGNAAISAGIYGARAERIARRLMPLVHKHGIGPIELADMIGRELKIGRATALAVAVSAISEKKS